MIQSVVLISEHASPLQSMGGCDVGGQNVYVRQLATYLANQGIRVDVYTRRDSPEIPTVVETKEGYRVRHVVAGPTTPVAKEDLLDFIPEFTDRMTEIMNQEGHVYDLCHAHFWMSGLVGLKIRERFGLPLVMTFHALGKIRRIHQGHEDRFPDERFTLEDAVAQNANLIIAESPQEKDDLVNLYAGDPSRIVVIPCGYDYQELHPVERTKARQHINVGEDATIILQLGRLVPRKDIENVIRGLRRYRDNTGRDALLMVVGGDGGSAWCPDIERLWNVAIEEGVENFIRFEGAKERDELKYYYSAADIFVTTPWYEPFGITPLEAMACGTPVIASAVGGLQSTISHEETGLLIPPRDPAALAKAMDYILRSEVIRQRMSLASLRHVKEHYPWETVCTAILQAYATVIPNLSISRQAI